MFRAMTAMSALALSAAAVQAGGVDRSGQSIDILFEEGNYAELGFSRTIPSVGGRGVGLGPVFPAGTQYDDVAGSFTTVTGGVKVDFNDRISGALIIENPYGADIEYDGGQFTSELGGTSAIADSLSVTALLRYKFNENWSVHGGLRALRSGGEITLSGLAYGAVNGYKVELDDHWAFGWLAGVAYERPDIALRVALTYSSEIVHEFDATETGPLIDPDGPGPLPPLPLLNASGTTDVTIPRSVNLDFQTGIAPDTLLFGQVRWVEWSEFQIEPDAFNQVTGVGLLDLEDTTTYTIGVGRRFNETWAGSISLAYEEGSDPLVSPLTPSNGFWALGIGGSYAINASTTLSAGVRYTWIGDSEPETGTPDVARADFRDNDAISFGMRIGFKF